MRYAIYLTPPPEATLAEAAATWLGRSPFRPGTMTPAAPEEASPHVPARYGFHATLRAPFHLADGVSEADLLATFAAFAAAQPPLRPVLTIATLSRFLAFRSDDAGLAGSAEASLAAFEPLRAPLSEADRARRDPDTLDERGRELLERWGYPFVMERFVFHMTLSGPLASAADVEAVRTAARAHFGALDGAAHPLVHAVYREDEPGGPFSIIATQSGAAPPAPPRTTSSSNADKS